MHIKKKNKCSYKQELVTNTDDCAYDICMRMLLLSYSISTFVDRGLTLSLLSFDFIANCAPYKSKLRPIPVILLQFQEDLHSMERYFAKARPRGQKQKLSLQRKSNVNVVALKASFYANGFDVSTS